MPKQKLSTVEILTLALVLIILAAGFYFFYTDRPRFDWYVKEDQLVEWLTVAGLLLGSMICFIRFFRLLRHRALWFLTVTFLLGLLLFVAAGEEISWGQRLLGIKSSEYFKKNNAQGETNLHNLVVGGVKINKLIFSTLLSIMLAVYLILIPVLYNKRQAVKNFMDKSGVPIARVYQILSIVAVFIITGLIKHEKSPELLECGAALVFFLIIAFPQNLRLFKK